MGATDGTSTNAQNFGTNYTRYGRPGTNGPSPRILKDFEPDTETGGKCALAMDVRSDRYQVAGT